MSPLFAGTCTGSCATCRAFWATPRRSCTPWWISSPWSRRRTPITRPTFPLPIVIITSVKSWCCVNYPGAGSSWPQWECPSVSHVPVPDRMRRQGWEEVGREHLSSAQSQAPSSLSCNLYHPLPGAEPRDVLWLHYDRDHGAKAKYSFFKLKLIFPFSVHSGTWKLYLSHQTYFAQSFVQNQK